MSRKVDVSKLAERLAQLNAPRQSGGGMSFIQIKDDRNVFRILPPFGESDMFYEEVFVHYGVGKTKDNPKGSMVVCPTTLGDHHACPICETAKEFYKMSKAKEDKYEKEAKSIGRKKRVYFNAIDRSDNLANFEFKDDKWFNKETDKEESPVKILATGVGIFKDVLGIFCDPDYGDITDPDEGRDIIVTKSGSGFTSKYEVKPGAKPTKIGFAEWEKAMNNLAALTKVKTYDEICDIIEGKAPGSGDSGDDEEETTTKAPPKEDKPAKQDKPPADPPKSESDDKDGLEAEIQAAMLRRRHNRS